MRAPLARFYLIALFMGMIAFLATQVDSQEGALAQPAVGPEPVPEGQKGVEVMARGPVHEAYAAPSAEAKPTQAIPKKPPTPLEEMAPEDRPDGDVIWIGGYWAYEDERQDFLWVSGCWRVKPENKEWVPGYWREVNTQWQWVGGFWANAAPVGNPPVGNPQAGTAPAKAQEVTYYPDPPAPPNIAPPGDPPGADMFYTPGYWQWSGFRYVWRAGYWNRIRPGYVYVASHYRWTPTGYVFIAGYWDYTVARRGVIYAPVVVSAAVPVTFVYTPVYAVPDGMITDAMFVRPAYAHYYFGDYYGPQYASQGYVTTVVYSRTYYEPIVVYQRYEYRDNPRWYDTQINIVFERNAGRAPVPPRTLVQQQTIINNTTIVQNNVVQNNVVNNNIVNNNTVVNKSMVLAPAKTVMAAKGIPSTKMDVATRTQVKQHAQAVQVASATERKKTELAPIPPGSAGKPITHALPVPTTPVAPKVLSAQGSGTSGGTVGTTKGNPLGGTLSHTGGASPGGALGTTKGPTTVGPTTGGPTTGGTPTGGTTTSGAAKGTATTDPLGKGATKGATDTKSGTPPSGGTVIRPMDPVRPPPPPPKKDDSKKKDR